MESIFEKQRVTHESIERLEQAIIDQLMLDLKTHRERLLSERTINVFLSRIEEKSKELCEVYTDKQGQRQDEFAVLTTRSATDFTEFYKRLEVIADHHRKYPDVPAEEPEMDFIQTTTEHMQGDDESLEALFSGEEGFGRYLDLNALYIIYFNLVPDRRLDYLRYLDEFDKFDAFSTSVKNTQAYREYLTQMLEYLCDFIHRAKPLFNTTELEESARLEFEKEWAAGKIPGWEEVASAYSNDQLYCDACQKHFTKQSVYDAHLTGKKHIKAQKKLEEDNPFAAQNGKSHVKEDKRKATAWKEWVIVRYMASIPDIREETKANIERKQSLTDRERTMELEREEVDIVDEESEDEEDARDYNPLKLPLGWDGKPIPYWLYKLHGLGVEYPCEICGGYVYMGRKAFDKHFQEARHSYAMKCLGISNSKHFQGITSMADAATLYEKLKRENESEEQRVNAMEECEDAEGNVYKRKTYEDLVRQGIIVDQNSYR